MQLLAMHRQSIAGGAGPFVHYSGAYDLAGTPLVTFSLTIYEIVGTTPNVSVQLQTSEEGETWADVGSSISLGLQGMTIGKVQASVDPYSRYLRARVLVSGTDVAADVTVALNSFASS